MSLRQEPTRSGDSGNKNPQFAPEKTPKPSMSVHGAEVACSHCGLPVPALRLVADSEAQFCCPGCETVYGILNSAGLEDYYGYRQRLGEQGRPVEVSDLVGSDFDSEVFRTLYCKPTTDGQLETTLQLEGVHCAACVWLVERVGRIEPAVSSARVDIESSRLELRFDPEKQKLSAIARSLQKMGYKPRPFRAREAEAVRRQELRRLLVRIGVAGASAGNVMLMAFALYSGAVGLDEAGTMDLPTRRFFEVASLIVSLPALWAGSLFFRGAWASLRTRTPHMDLPIALGILGGFAWGAYGALTGRGELYFDSITTLVFFLLVGRYVQRRHQMAQSEAAELVHAVLPSDATVVHSSGRLEIIGRDEVEVDMVVLVQSGEVLVVDGVVCTGESSLDKSLLSGESRPCDVRPGDLVEAGALNLGQKLTVRATSRGSTTRVARLMSEVERALSTKTPLTAQADRLAGGFTLFVIALAAIVFVWWWPRGPALSVEHALSLLIVACPCALGLATPLALSSAVKKAAAQKKLVFAPEALEQLGGPLEIVLDKTGTLTHGRLRVIGYLGDTSLLGLAAALETDARHPVGRAIAQYVEALGVDKVAVDDIQEELGKGLTGRSATMRYAIGSRAHVIGKGAPPAQLDTMTPVAEGESPIFVWAADGRLGRFVVGDVLRDDAARSLKLLAQMGHRLHLLSGDDPEAALSVARQLERDAQVEGLFCSAQGGVSPEDKLARIVELKAHARSEQSGRAVVMVGDGINDAGALALADVGIAVQGAAEASRMSAQVYLPRAGVAELLELVWGARKTLQIIRRGLGFSLFYNAIGILCAALGLLGPLGAAILMPLSSLTVVTNAYRSRSFGKTPGEACGQGFEKGRTR